MPKISASELSKHIALLKSHNKKVRMKAILLDSKYNQIDSLSGRIKSSSYDKDSKSDIRSTCSITLSIPKKEQISLNFENTWNDRLVEISCGIYSTTDNDYVWYKFGRLLMTSGSSTFNATTQEVKLNLVDVMASITQERGSQIGTNVMIPAGSNTKNAIIAVIATYGKYKRYSVCDFGDTIPYDLEFDSGIYPVDILKKIIGLFPEYEMFYDDDGIFTVQKIPTKIEDPVDIGAEIIDSVIISENKSVNFSDVKNTTEIWGKELHGDYVAKSCSMSNGCYNVVIDTEAFTQMSSGEMYTVVPSASSVDNQTMKIQDFDAYPIYIESSDVSSAQAVDSNNSIYMEVGSNKVYTKIKAYDMRKDTPYVVKYYEEKFILQGELQIRCIVQEVISDPPAAAKEHYRADNACDNVQWIVNPDSPFACTVDPSTQRIQGEIKQVLIGGEYEGIYTTQLAYERGRYENWLKCRLQDTVEVEMILIPWMEINQKVQYTSPVTGSVGTWIVQAIDYDFAKWTMTVRLNRFYPYYPW